MQYDAVGWLQLGHPCCFEMVVCSWPDALRPTRLVENDLKDDYERIHSRYDVLRLFRGMLRTHMNQMTMKIFGWCLGPILLGNYWQLFLVETLSVWYIYIWYPPPPPIYLPFCNFYWYLQLFYGIFGAPFFWHFWMTFEVVFVNVYKRYGSIVVEWIQDPRSKILGKLFGSKVWIQDPRF